MRRVRCFLLEPTGEEWRSADGHTTAPLYRDPRTGALTTYRDADPGAMIRATWASWVHSQDDGAPLAVKLPSGEIWYIDEQADNCGLPDDREQRRHHCWLRHGEPPDVTVDKSGGPTCTAGSGSIATDRYHGFLRNGWLED